MNVKNFQGCSNLVRHLFNGTKVGGKTVVSMDNSVILSHLKHTKIILLFELKHCKSII